MANIFTCLVLERLSTERRKYTISGLNLILPLHSIFSIYGKLIFFGAIFSVPVPIILLLEMRDVSDEGVNCFKEIEMDEIMGKGLLQLHPPDLSFGWRR